MVRRAPQLRHLAEAEIADLARRGLVCFRDGVLVPTVAGGVAPPLANTFEGGTPGSAITTANSGAASGDAFNAIGGSPVFANTPVRGTVSMQVVDAAVLTAVRWTGLGSLTTSVYARNYLYLTANPTTNPLIFSQMRTTGEAGTTATLQVNTAGHLQTVLPTGTVVYTTTATVPLNAWFRVEYRILPSATAGEFEVRLYGTNDTTLTETHNDTGLVLAANTDAIRWGVFTPLPATPYTVTFDDLAVSTTGWIGASAGTVARPAADVSAGLWTPSVGTALYPVINETAPVDTDYIQSSASPATADVAKVRLSPVAAPSSTSGHVVSYRYQKDQAGGDRIDLVVTLYAANGTTVIASWTHTDIGNTVVEADQSLTTTQAGTIPLADYATGLVLGFSAVKV